MSQHDITLADQAGVAFLADVNSAIQALVTNSSGATEPTTTYAYQWWADTTTGLLKQRNSANSGWIDILKMSTGAPVAAAPRATRIDVASAATLDLTANAPDTDDIRLTGTAAVTLVTIAVGRVVRVVASGASSFANNANIVTQTGATLQLAAGDTLMLRATAANVVEVLGFVPATTAVPAVIKVGVRQTVLSAPVGGAQSTVTITNATPGVVTHTAHGQEANTPYHFASTTGALPTGFSVNTQYYISATGLTTNTFQLSATAGGASIATSSAGSGIHTGQVGYVGNPAAPILGGALGGTSFTTSNLNSTTPLVLTAANGADANGDVNVVGRSTANLTWTTLSTNGAWGLFADVASGAITPVNGCLPLPVYQFGGVYSATSGQFTFNYDVYVGKVGNGSAAVQTSRVCLGEVTVAGGVVTAITWYALQGQYDSGYTSTLPGAGTLTSKNHNIGFPPEIVKVSFKNLTTDASYAVGDIVSPVLSHGVTPTVTQSIASRLAVTMQAGESGIGWLFRTKSTGVIVVGVAANWAYKFTASRGW